MVKRSVTLLQRELGKRQPCAWPEEEALLHVLRTADVLSCPLQHLLREHGLSLSLYNALRIVVGSGEAGVPVRVIAERMVVRQPDTSRLVDRLEQRGLVSRQRCREDRRVVYVRPTAAGQAKVQQTLEPLAELHRQLLGHLGPRRLAQLNTLLAEARRPRLATWGKRTDEPIDAPTARSDHTPDHPPTDEPPFQPCEP